MPVACSYAQNPQWVVYDKSNSGLPGNQVTSIATDSFGNMWFGTGFGLAKFDGNNWTIYNISNSGLPDNSISKISTDMKDAVWIGSDLGFVTKFDGTNWTVYNQSNSVIPTGCYIYSITPDDKGNIWICTGQPKLATGGLVKFDGTNWTIYTKKNSGLPYNKIMSVGIDAEGNKWIAATKPIDFYHAGNLVKFDNTNWTIYDSTNSCLPAFEDINLITIDIIGNKWFGTNLGLVKFNGSSCIVYDTTNSDIPSNDIFAIAIDNKGNKWIGTYRGNGLGKFDGTNWTLYNTLNSGIPTNNIFAIAIDRYSNKWIASDIKGLAVFNEKGVNYGFAVSGTVRYDNADSSLLGNVVVSLKNKEGKLIARDTTAADGMYLFSKVPNGDYAIELTVNKAWGGSDPGDALLINRNYIGSFIIKDLLKVEAAEVNLDGNIDPGDALMINNRYIGKIDAFTSVDWLIDLTSITVDNQNLIVNIKTICAGDADGSYAPAK